MKRQLILEDGTRFIGKAFGYSGSKQGELVFNNGMTGYQETISDPSYCGQIVLMTYPLIGNYGINREDFESVQPSLHGLVVKEICEHPSNFRSDQSMDSYLKANKIPGIAGIDTRQLMKHIRKNGIMRAVLTEYSNKIDDVEVKWEPPVTDQVKQVSTKSPYVIPGDGKHIILIDYGMTHGIIRQLIKRDCHVTVVPYHYTAENIQVLKPDGVMLSNGPGNPKDLPEAIETIRDLIDQFPIFGVCLGHQLLALACGANTEKMDLGHHGSNRPVKNIMSKKTCLTSQNHIYKVTKSSLKDTKLILTHSDLNDGTVMGLRHQDRPAFSVQYLPTSTIAPEDTKDLYDQFIIEISQFSTDRKGII
ncbi:carbamoyl phosphate synthase small subunit [Amphibacillus sp. MSJ-3]|uniref:carbamoyl phosphate synthase small subunit n=1 Tax=Amphibacillus sp. MSJ-3 TaxID=2841505 RepID=UPI001C0EC98D|nr:carbamoyl phosphate synthase small subunit [Amphibacillus sp. MSJ-3]MBU5594621.1 carbamoyl phosphate synthase small subunit [Amphibacillus sp. MSJ-3]